VTGLSNELDFTKSILYNPNLEILVIK
jgi:hypothetical protein